MEEMLVESSGAGGSAVCSPHALPHALSRCITVQHLSVLTSMKLIKSCPSKVLTEFNLQLSLLPIPRGQ